MTERDAGRLLDESAVRDLFTTFSATLDAQDWDGYAGTFREDGSFEVFGQLRQGRREIAAGAQRDLSAFARTQHFNSNHRIAIDGDRASGQVSLLAVHVPDGDHPEVHADAGGVYTFEAVRTPDGWRFARLQADVLWTAGRPLPFRPGSAGE